MIVQGAFNQILRPGLMDIFTKEYEFPAASNIMVPSMVNAQEAMLSRLLRYSEERTGVYEVPMGVPPTGVARPSLKEEAVWPPTDWPDYP